MVEIDTLWNVKVKGKGHPCRSIYVEIDTLWNVKDNGGISGSITTSRNRYIVECKATVVRVCG